MSDMGLEATDADAAEQEREVMPEVSDPEEPEEPEELPLEANPADSAEQARVLDLDDDEYR